MVFSSDFRSIKPSRKLFDQVYKSEDVGEDTLMVGDSLTRDILPATTYGMWTAWIDPEMAKTHPRPEKPDYVIPSLFGLDEDV